MTHEQLKDFQYNKNISNKTFGIQLSVILFIIFLIRLYFKHFEVFEVALLSLSIFFIIISFLKPTLLNFFRKIFFKLAILLAKIINPLVMLVFYIFIFVPFGLILKLFNYDPLEEKINKNVETYWDTFKSENKNYFKKQF